MNMFMESHPEHPGASLSRKKLKDLPILMPSHYCHTNILGVLRNYHLNCIGRVFMTFQDPRSRSLHMRRMRACVYIYISKLGMMLRVIIKLTIVLNTIAYVLSWSPDFMEAPDDCENPVCDNDPDLCPDKMVCAPVSNHTMYKTQITCMLVLLVEFIVTASTCWSVPARLAGVLDLKYEKQRAAELENSDNCDTDLDDIINRDLYAESSGRIRSASLLGMSGRLSMKEGFFQWKTSHEVDAEVESDPTYPSYIQVARFITTGKNIRSFVAVFPLLCVLMITSHEGQYSEYTTVARMVTLVKLADVISVLIGSVVFLLERGEYVINDEYPDGAYLRQTVTGHGKEESPFTSTGLSLYWVVVTLTSVGYGDLVCTSTWGRLISCVLMILSIFILALPIAIIGQILTEEVDKYMAVKANRESNIAKQLDIRASNVLIEKYSKRRESSRDSMVTSGTSRVSLHGAVVRNPLAGKSHRRTYNSRSTESFDSLSNRDFAATMHNSMELQQRGSSNEYETVEKQSEACSARHSMIPQGFLDESASDAVVNEDGDDCQSITEGLRINTVDLKGTPCNDGTEDEDLETLERELNQLEDEYSVQVKVCANLHRRIVRLMNVRCNILTAKLSKL